MSQNKRKSNAEDENVEEEQLVANNTEDENKFAIPKLKPKCRKFIFKPFKRESDGLLMLISCKLTWPWSMCLILFEKSPTTSLSLCKKTFPLCIMKLN